MPRYDAILDASSPVSPLSIPASQTAVLLLDYHNFILPRIPGPDGARALSGAQKLRAWARSHGVLVVHGLIDAPGHHLPTYKGAGNVGAIHAAIEKSPELAAENADIAAPTGGDQDAEPTLYRTLGQVSAMRSRGIREMLTGKGIRSLVLGGVATSGCVLRTSMEAADDGFIVTAVEDACADPDPAVHELMFEKVLRMQVHPVGFDEWEAAWTKAYP